MAIYHCSVKAISRGARQSIVAAAAYRHGCRMEDKRTGEVHDYSRKRGVTVSAAFFPSGVDCSWATKSEILWNTAELAEKRKDARLGREIVLALPSELSPTERKALAAEMAQHVADRYGVAVDAAIHAPSRQGDDRNFHVHMLVSARRITSKGFGEKTRELDDRERGPAEVEHLRAEWARLANRALEQAGQHVQIDHRSFRRQGVKRMPSRHLGASATALERRGIKTRIGDGNRAAARLNALAGQLEAEQAACVSLTEQAKRAAQEVRQCGVDLSREASSVSRPAMPRPTPQRAAEAPQRAMSSPSLVERAGAGPGSLHGAVERREGTPAAVRPEAARPEPQKGAEAPQRAVSSPSLVERAGAGPGSLHGAVERREGTRPNLCVEVLAGAELLQEIDTCRRQALEALSELNEAERKLGNEKYYLMCRQYDLEEFKEMNTLNKVLNIFNLKRINKSIEECEKRCAEQSEVVDKLKFKRDECDKKLREVKKAYENSPHGLNAARQELQKRQEEQRLRDSQVQRQERQKPLEKKEPHQQHSQTPRLRMR